MLSGEALKLKDPKRPQDVVGETVGYRIAGGVLLAIRRPHLRRW